MGSGRGTQILLVLILGVALVIGVAVHASAENFESPGLPASILYSTMLPQEYPVMAVSPAGTIYVAGADVERITAESRRVMALTDFPKRTAGHTKMPAVWALGIAAGKGSMAVTGESTERQPVPIARGGTHVHPHGSSVLVAWRSSPGGVPRSLTLSGTCSQSPRAIAIDLRGDVLVAGVTTSDNFPTVHAVQSAFAGPPSHPFCPRTWHSGLQTGDVFLTRISSRGAITYSTYLGGKAGDEPRALATDAAGNMYLAGLTYSSDFPQVRGFEQAGHGPVCYRDTRGAPHYCWRDFVAKVSRDGKLDWVTVLPLGSDSGEVHAMAVHRGSVYLVGETTSGDLPTVHAAQPSYGGGSCEDYDGLGIRCRDAWVTRLTPRGSIAFTTYLGGSGDDVGQSIAVDGNGDIYVGGTTDSIGTHIPDVWFTDFPRIRMVTGAPGGTRGCQLPSPCGDAFVARLSNDGKILGSWALGGSDNEDLMDLDLDAVGHVYVSGFTSSCNFPIVKGTRLHGFPLACPGAFVTELRLP